VSNQYPSSDVPPPKFEHKPTYAPRPPVRPVRIQPPATPPTVTYGLIGITIVAFILQYLTEYSAGYDFPAVWGAKINAAIAAGEYWRLITPVFLHGSIFHIGFNMYALYLFGRGLERSYGHGRFLTLYLLGGFGGNVLSMMFTDAPSLGASTAIFGLLGAQGVFIYQNKALFGGMTRRALQEIISIAVINLVIGMSPGIDNWGHVGGLIAGLIFSWLGGPILAPDGGFPVARLVDQRSSKDVLLAAMVTLGFFMILAVGAIYLMG
jgi:rhomboid protease GluP